MSVTEHEREKKGRDAAHRKRGTDSGPNWHRWEHVATLVAFLACQIGPSGSQLRLTPEVWCQLVGHTVLCICMWIPE